ncbi:MAG TPA: glycosyltransferase family 1 protein [Candidatus Omnitrophota bacterium]|nr:glycosyltransferase family 1 protein [Candidatus Omnitrophota bacterium]
MKIAIDIRSTLKKRTGIGNYTFGLVNALARADKDSQYLLYSYIRPFDFKRRLWPLPAGNFRHKVDRMSFDPRSTLSGADVVHTSSYDIPSSRSYRLFTTVHDLVPLMFPHGYSEDYLKGLDGELRRVFRESKAVIADSENTKKDIERMFPDCKPRVEVIYPGRDESFKAMEKKDALNSLGAAYGIHEKFLLYSGGMDPRKNMPCLVEAFRILKARFHFPHRLVLTGARGKWAEDTSRLVSQAGLDREVLFTGYVPSYELNRFYSAADCFVYPSLYEGFGFPILEAFASGTPVVTSAVSSCAEIASDAALTFDPRDPEGLAAAIRKVLSDKELSDSLISKGKERAGFFSWDSSSRRILELFRGR